MGRGEKLVIGGPTSPKSNIKKSWGAAITVGRDLARPGVVPSFIYRGGKGGLFRGKEKGKVIKGSQLNISKLRGRFFFAARGHWGV